MIAGWCGLLRCECAAHGHSEAKRGGEGDDGDNARMFHRDLLLYRKQRLATTMPLERSNRKMTDH
jgi:hypothetical protein